MGYKEDSPLLDNLKYDNYIIFKGQEFVLNNAWVKNSKSLKNLLNKIVKSGKKLHKLVINKAILNNYLIDMNVYHFVYYHYNIHYSTGNTQEINLI